MSEDCPSCERYLHDHAEVFAELAALREKCERLERAPRNIADGSIDYPRWVARLEARAETYREGLRVIGKPNRYDCKERCRHRDCTQARIARETLKKVR